MSGKTEAGSRVLSGTFVVERKGRVVRLSSEAPREKAEAKVEPARRPAHVARMLALAHHIQGAIDRRVVADRAEVARKLGLTRARITQLLDLTLLAPDLQVRVLELEAVDGVEPLTERQVREVVHAGSWAQQRAKWAMIESRLSGPKAMWGAGMGR